MTKDESRLLLRLPTELRERLEELAAKEYRSLTGEILHLLNLALKQKEAAAGDDPA